MFNPNSIKVPSYGTPTHIVSISALFFIPENDFSFNKQNLFSGDTPVLRKDTRVTVHKYGIGPSAKWALVSLEDGSKGYVVYKDSLSPLQGIPQFYDVNPNPDYQANNVSQEINWRLQPPKMVYDDAFNGAYTVHIEMENVVDFNGGETILREHLNNARIQGTREILGFIGYKDYERYIIKFLYESYLFSVAEEWYLDTRPCSTLRVAVSIPKRFLFAKEKEIDAEVRLQNKVDQETAFAPSPDLPLKPPSPPLVQLPELDVKNCVIDTATRIKDLATIKTPLEINKWLAINRQYERNRLKIESDLFTRSLMEANEIKDANMRILLGYDKLSGKTDKQKLQIYISIARSLDWAKFLGLAAQCLSRPIPLDELTELMGKYKEARKFIDQILASTLCNPYLKNGLKIVKGFELPVIRAYNPNEALARELEAIFVKITTDLVSIGIRKALEAAARACAADPTANFNTNGPSLNPMNLENADQDPSVRDFLDEALGGVGQSPTEEERAEAKEQLKNMLNDISACVTFKELCGLYRGSTVNDEVYQVAISIIKRKYPQFLKTLSTREDVLQFFKTLGSRLDLSLCADETEPEIPSFSKDGTNILCDDGSLQDLRRNILTDRGLTPDLIDELLDSKKKEEAKALEDVLKLLNSENPFDFSQVPDLGCKVFPNGESIAPSMQSFTAMMNSMVRSIYDTFDAEAADWYKTTYSSVDPNKTKILKFNETTGDIEIEKNINPSEDQKKSIKANSGKVLPGKQETDSVLPSGIDEIKYPSFIFKKNMASGQHVLRNNINNKKQLKFSVNLDGDLQQKMDLDFIQTNLKQGIQAGELSLSLFAKRVWSQVIGVFGAELTRIAATMAINESYNRSYEPVYITLQPMIGFLASLDTFLRSNVPDAEELKTFLKDAYLVLDLDDTQMANGLFAAENGAAIYLAICEQLKNPQTRAFITSLSVAESEIDSVIAQYEQIKDYYRSILRLKINYPDFNISRLYGLESVITPNGIEVSTIFDGALYDIQKLEVLKNNRSHIKITEISRAPEGAQRFLNRLNFDFYDGVSRSKEDLFEYYIKKKIDIYGFSEDGELVDTEKNFGSAYEDAINRLYSKTAESIFNTKNKFLYLKDLSSPFLTAMQETGSGQPYTQYLKLVLPQTPEQKLCNVRPHYLDIDNIKQDIIQEKANNICIEKVADSRTIGNQPLPSSQMQEIETSSTQDSMLRGMYRLAVRVFLHDLLLRGIALFGHYDPQTLRDEPMFISFMSKMAESEMRGMDNTFFNMLIGFLKKTNPQANESLLFRDFVEGEIKYVVLPKLAKRINDDTNFALTTNKPKDNPIKLTNILDEVVGYNIFEVKNKAVYLLLNLDFLPNTSQPRKQFKVYQKIYENTRAPTDEQVLREFITSDEYVFLFRYLFPMTQILNDFFVTSCLSASTRKQVVNSFKGTKRDVITTAKIIQTNGQEIIKNPNSSQELVDDPMQLIAGFLLQMAFKTPINVLKGIAESTEPNIALTSTAFKIARAFVPNLTSFLIPAVSVPLGTLPTPITCPLPFINPLLSIAYFATLAWYDDKPPEEMVNNAISALESSISKTKIVCGDNVINQDKFYQDKVTNIGSSYDVSRDASTQTAQEATQQQLIDARYEQQKAAVIQKILTEINPDLSKITKQKAIELIARAVLLVEALNNVHLLADTENAVLKGHYTTALSESRTAIANYINSASSQTASSTTSSSTSDADPAEKGKPRGGNMP